jgi:death-on-curing protein
MGSIRYVGIEDALALHATVIGLTSGALGVRDMNSLQSCLERPKTTIGGTEMFADVFAKAASLIESIARNHPFLDGNKRTSFLTGTFFLHQNDCDLLPEEGEIEKCMLWIVLQKPSIEEIAVWLEENTSKN